MAKYTYVDGKKVKVHKSYSHPFWTTLGIIFAVLIAAAGVTALVGWLGFGWFTTEAEEEVVEIDPNAPDEGFWVDGEFDDETGEDLTDGVQTGENETGDIGGEE